MKQGEIFHNRYFLNELIGNGGFSQVWKSQDMQSGLEVAVKIFIRQDDEGIRLCRKEFSKTYQLRHANILTTMHFDVMDNIPYLVMPYISGGTLDQRLGNLNNSEIYKFVEQLGSVLKYIHYSTNPVIHGDIKPDNVLIDGNGNFLLTDFGISTELKEKFTQTMNMEQLQSKPSGITPMAFRAPELNQYKDWETQAVSQKSDIWAAGIVLYNLCKGRLPFNGDGGLGQIIMMRTAKSDSVSEFLNLEQIPADLRKLIVKCLQLNPTDRPALFELEKESENGTKPIFNSQKIESSTLQNPVAQSYNYRSIGIFLVIFLIGISSFGFWLSNYTNDKDVNVSEKIETTQIDSDGNPILQDADTIISTDDNLAKELDKKNVLIDAGQIISPKTINADVKNKNIKSNRLSNNANNDNRVSNLELDPEMNFRNTTQPEVIRTENKTVASDIKEPTNPTPKSEIKAEPESTVSKEIPYSKASTSSSGSTKVASNIPIKLMLKNNINMPHNLNIGSKLKFLVMEDVMGQSAVFLQKNAEVEAIVKRVSDDKITIDFPYVFSSGETKIKTYRARFDISADKGQSYMAKAMVYKVVIYTNEKIDVKL